MMLAFTLQLFTFPFVVNHGRMQSGLHKHNIKNGRRANKFAKPCFNDNFEEPLLVLHGSRGRLIENNCRNMDILLERVLLCFQLHHFKHT